MPDTPLAKKLRGRIMADGPLSVADFMQACLADPQFGYYRTRDPLGVGGDFTTAPEISQIFGELIGLWCAEVWRQMGMPDPVRLVELGPGRGTLMADAMRAAAIVPEFVRAAQLHLVETSPVLRAAQQERLVGFEPRWHDALGDVPAGAMLLVANEFLDALPVRQFVRGGGQWRERYVNTDGDENFAFCEHPAPLSENGLIPAKLTDAAQAGEIVEIRECTGAAILDLAERAASDPLAALFIDYGYTHSAPGDTFQAVSGHGYADPLAAPGEQDLTAHVDFESLALAARTAGLGVHGPVEQGSFLYSLGLAQRCEQLMKKANANQARTIESAARRLVDPAQMGALFKVLAITGPAAPPPPPF